MATWIAPALFALINFGLWGLFTKLTVLSIDPKSALLYQTIGVMIISAILLNSLHFKPTFAVKGILFGILTGATYGVGCLFYFIAASKGKIIHVVTLTALYPLITIILSLLLLKETIQMKQTIGIILALIAIILISS